MAVDGTCVAPPGIHQLHTILLLDQVIDASVCRANAFERNREFAFINGHTRLNQCPIQTRLLLSFFVAVGLPVCEMRGGASSNGPVDAPRNRNDRPRI